MKYTHSDLVNLGKTWLTKKGCGVVYSELKTWNNSGEIPDVLGFRSSTSILIECKTSISDFKADSKKPFRIKPEKGMGDWRFFLTVKGLLKDIELPKGWGLLEVSNNKIRIKSGGPKGNSWYKRPFKANYSAERSFLYSIIRRLQGDYEQD